mgnify:CR=1 FL=1
MQNDPVAEPGRAQAEMIDWLRLIRSRRVGPTTFWRLLAEHGTVAAALAALPEVARAAGVVDYTPCAEGVARAEIRAGQAAGARLVHAGMAAYPQALRDLPDAPPVLWALGDTGLLNRPMVALVGARNASSLGLRMARKLAAGLAGAGYVVVSGLARGIDAAAHEAALTAGGTVAVQAGGIDVIYPPGHDKLSSDIARRGLCLSEMPPGVQPLARHFPMRNRLISGLCRAVVVVEAAARSGSLITARDALDQGREVLVVPGHPLDARAAGCNLLIREGATLVRGVEDILEVLGRSAEGGVTPPLINDLHVAKTGDDRPMLPDASPGEPTGERVGRIRKGPPEHSRNIPDRAAGGRPATPRAKGETARNPTQNNKVTPVQPDDKSTTAGSQILGASQANNTRQRRGDPNLKKTASLHSRILERLGPSPLAEDQLIRDLDLPAASVAPELVTLELDGRIERQAGGLLSRVQ